MTNNIKNIYEANNKIIEEQPRITESFSETLAKNKNSRVSLNKSASPSAISQALRVVMENEGPRFVNHTGGTMIRLVGEVLGSGSRCA